LTDVIASSWPGKKKTDIFRPSSERRPENIRLRVFADFAISVFVISVFVISVFVISVFAAGVRALRGS